MESLVLLYVVGYGLAQYGAIRTMRGWWRTMAMIPAIVTGLVVAFTVLAFAAQSNLWPLVLILTAPLVALYLLLLWLAYGVARWVQSR